MKNKLTALQLIATTLVLAVSAFSSHGHSSRLLRARAAQRESSFRRALANALRRTWKVRDPVGRAPQPDSRQQVPHHFRRMLDALVEAHSESERVVGIRAQHTRWRSFECSRSHGFQGAERSINETSTRVRSLTQLHLMTDRRLRGSIVRSSHSARRSARRPTLGETIGSSTTIGVASVANELTFGCRARSRISVTCAPLA